MTRHEYLERLLTERVVMLDGATGTMIQKQGLGEEDFTLEGNALVGCNEVLNLTRGDVIYGIHTAYLEAGSDIIETNTFCGNAFNLAEYGLSGEVETINRAACEIAREAAADFEATHEGYAFVAGSIGPTNRSLAFSPKVEDPAYRQSDFDGFLQMFTEQAKALIEGGVDLLLIETVFDTLVAKSAIIACFEEMKRQDRKIPVMVSVTFSDQSLRTLSGQTLEAFLVSLSSFPLFSVGLNCSTGPKEMIPLIEELSSLCPFYVSAHPNAGFPDKEGNYTLWGNDMAAQLKGVLETGKLNILGGCCGTGPDHIRILKEATKTAKPRLRPQKGNTLQLSGLESITALNGELLVIGERTNVAGSRKFARLIQQQKWEEALQVARAQVEEGAQAIDVCMDASMLDAHASMVAFLRYLASDPSISKVPLMLDSSDWSVLEVALKEVQGRGIVNSISLKEGEEVFLSHARHIAKYGCAMMVMLFDENGQADTYERKIEVAKRSHDLLVAAGIAEESIIFDPNVLSIATGIDEHDYYARDFIKAAHTLKELYPLCHTSGGVSNLSFSFRGNDWLRNAMHALFLQFAKLDMAIINPSSMMDVNSLDPEDRKVITEALLCEGGTAPELRARLIALALRENKTESESKVKAPDAFATLEPKPRLAHAVLKGENSYLEQDLSALEDEDPIGLVEGPLMDGMKEVGRLFGLGKLFLPQVVRSARTMKLAVDILQPRIAAVLKDQNAEGEGQRKKVAVMATVKGDVHDIGKNIVNLILRCNAFEVIDLGVMVPSHVILEAAIEHKADLVGLSGLITPSLKEMEHTITAFEQAGIDIPIFVGGATTSELHSAVKLAPLYSKAIIHTKDASAMALAASEVMGPQKDSYLSTLRMSYDRLRVEHNQPKKEQNKTESGYEEALFKQLQKSTGTKAATYGVFVKDSFKLEDILSHVNWRMYSAGWKVPPASEEGQNLIKQAKELLEEKEVRELFEAGCKVAYGLFPASSDRLSVVVGEKKFHFLRCENTGLCLADYIAKDDTVGLFVTTSGLALDPYLEKLEKEGDMMRLFSIKLIADRLAEALSDVAELLLREKWGTEVQSFLRPAPGYSSWNDHSEKGTLFSLLDATQRIGVKLTESYAMQPASSVCGMVIGGENLRYFMVRDVSEAQIALYAKAKGVAPQALATLLAGMEY